MKKKKGAVSISRASRRYEREVKETSHGRSRGRAVWLTARLWEQQSTNRPQWRALMWPDAEIIFQKQILNMEAELQESMQFHFCCSPSSLSKSEKRVISTVNDFLNERFSRLDQLRADNLQIQTSSTSWMWAIIILGYISTPREELSDISLSSVSPHSRSHSNEVLLASL